MNARWLTNLFYRGLLFEPANFSIFFCFALDLNALPRKLPTKKVQEQVPQGFQIILSSLLLTSMRSNTSITCSPNQGFPDLPRNMLTISMVPFSKSKINDINNVSFLPSPDHKIICLQISMNKALTMNSLQSKQYLESNIIDSRKRKFPVIKLKHLLQ